MVFDASELSELSESLELPESLESSELLEPPAEDEAVEEAELPLMLED